MSVQPELTSRIESDDSSAGPVLFFFATAVAWLLIGSVFGLVVAFKFSFPDWLGDAPALTFGRLRPAHLNTVIYGWASLALCGVFVW
ncbi:MAG: cbb3-type cytochrome c oxidase subunit I, partial [Candidatus Dadabacteria bacterium]|nr:cbb3-type cytochrome c oxidase subunit I [Candidatus Dadabacteria bacterium]